MYSEYTYSESNIPRKILREENVFVKIYETDTHKQSFLYTLHVCLSVHVVAIRVTRVYFLLTIHRTPQYTLSDDVMSFPRAHSLTPFSKHSVLFFLLF